jgi:hypothetical protein
MAISESKARRTIRLHLRQRLDGGRALWSALIRQGSASALAAASDSFDHEALLLPELFTFQL